MKIAHTKPGSDEVQTIRDHAYATAALARQRAVPPLDSIAYLAGLLHDIGKYQHSFQKKIVSNKNIRVDHSTCGAIEAARLFGKNALLTLLLQYCIAGHHTGIPDGGNLQDTKDDPSLCGRLKRSDILEDYADYRSEITIDKPDENAWKRFLRKTACDDESLIETFAFIVRYVFSCLTDADALDTAAFCSGRTEKELTSDFAECLRKIEQHLAAYELKNETALQKARSVLQKQVYEKAAETAEIYLMNMPTGSGKTLCSMKFALLRAIRSGKKRIIYVIPYNSIIDQTVAVLEEIFGDSARILRHQSSYCEEDSDRDEDDKALYQYAVENWNAQIIVTTSVQFFESLYSNKRRRLRKMHNMADSMLIFDEAHLMPEEYLQPCLRAVAYLTRLLNSEAVFLTATMPDFEKLIQRYALKDCHIVDLITDRSLNSRFQKGRYVNLGTVTESQLLQRAADAPSALIVVNKRESASRLYDMASGKKYHLSTYMTAFDRKRVIDTIKQELEALSRDYPAREAVPPCRRITVISTSLIEAGVDLDFFTVYRELSGLDSILQAGGRCNREGKRENAVIHIFRWNEGRESTKETITRELLKQYEDLTSPECIRDYYDKLYQFNEEQIRISSIVHFSHGVTKLTSIPFASYANEFHFIKDNTVAVAVECDEESKALLTRLKATGFTDHRRLQQYTFSVYSHELNELSRQGAVKEYGGIWCLENTDYYSREKGISLAPKDYYI